MLESPLYAIKNHEMQYCAKVMRANFDEIRALFSAGFFCGSRVTGHGSRVTGHRSRVTGHGSRVTGHRSRVTGHMQFY